MDTFRIEWKRSAIKELEKLVSTENSYRIRIGDYRVLYNIVENKLIVEIIRVRHRKDVYR